MRGEQEQEREGRVRGGNEICGPPVESLQE